MVWRVRGVRVGSQSSTHRLPTLDTLKTAVFPNLVTYKY